MAGKTFGSWIRRTISGRDAVDAGPRVGQQVSTNEGELLGTIKTIWRGADATDGAPHEETLGVLRAETDETGIIYVPSGAIARASDQGVVLAVDGAQVIARGWRHRPTWLPREDHGALETTG